MRHRLAFSGTYMLPGRRYVMTRGWQLQAIGTLQIGLTAFSNHQSGHFGYGKPDCESSEPD